MACDSRVLGHFVPFLHQFCDTASICSPSVQFSLALSHPQQDLQIRNAPLTSVQDIVFELCAESLDACLLAKENGASRIELCADLQVEGLTPSHALIQAAIQQSGLPVHVLLRPRVGNFVYTEIEFALMADDLLHGKELGASGFALGILQTDDTVDTERTAKLVKLAAPLEVTFHRAFDVTPSLPQALEDVIRTGCRRILTSGGAADVFEGAPRLAELVRLAQGRIEMAVGGGLRVAGAASLVAATQARHYHGSVRRPTHDRTQQAQVDPHEVRQLVASLNRGATA